MPHLTTEAIYQNALKLREDGVTQAQAAEVLGVSRATIWRWWSHRSTPFGHHANSGSFKKGHVPWITGRTHSQETREKMSGPRPGFSNKTSFKPGQHASPETEFKKGETNLWLGHKHSEKTKALFSRQRKGRIPWNKGKSILLGPKQHSQETKLKMSSIRTEAWKEEGKYGTNKWREKQSLAHKQLWQNPEYAERMLNKMHLPKPNKQEVDLDTLIQQNFPREWKYTGDGRDGTRIGRKTPDWININGRKAIIELFGHLWHLPKHRNEHTVKEYYSQYGFDCLVIWSRELKNPNKVINKIRRWQDAALALVST